MPNPPVQFQASYLPGLNTLRFFAAFFVIVSHLPNSWVSLGYCSTIEDFDRYFGQLLHRGFSAVEFFFTLSGFLITYLLIQENRKTQNISLKDFYIRRVLRIWPLYFLVMIAGFIILGYLYPLISHKTYLTFSVWEGVLLYTFFLPNLAKSLWDVGMLAPLWSIGVEEQFYLFWAPLMKLFRKNILPILLIFIALSVTFFATFRHFHLSPNLEGFFDSLKFHYMAIGGLFAYITCFYPKEYNASFLAKPIFQAFVWIWVLYYYIFGIDFKGAEVILLPLMYAFLIMSVAIVSKPLLNIEVKAFTYLGEISYGLYMYHKLADYFLRLIYPKLGLHFGGNTGNILLYSLLQIGLTILIAHFSYQYFEKYFMNLKRKFQKV